MTKEIDFTNVSWGGPKNKEEQRHYNTIIRGYKKLRASGHRDYFRMTDEEMDNEGRLWLINHRVVKKMEQHIPGYKKMMEEMSEYYKNEWPSKRKRK